MSVDTHTFYKGLLETAQKMTGNEIVHVGIRPYEMHAGNLLAIVAYPVMLCRALKKQGKIPNLQIILSLNDFEQNMFVGKDIYKYPFDVKPKGTTIQYTEEESGQRTVDVWASRIIKALSEITKRYPNTTVTPVFNSDLKNHPVMKQVIIKTITHKDDLKKVLLNSTNIPTIGEDFPMATALCKKCKSVDTVVSIEKNEELSVSCNVCKSKFQDDYSTYSFWLFHKPLFSARWKIFGFNYSISGGDHLSQKDQSSREALYKFYFEEEPPQIDMLFSPTLLASDGQKMSKSRNNHTKGDLDNIINLARGYNQEELPYEYA